MRLHSEKMVLLQAWDPQTKRRTIKGGKQVTLMLLPAHNTAPLVPLMSVKVTLKVDVDVDVDAHQGPNIWVLEDKVTEM